MSHVTDQEMTGTRRFRCTRHWLSAALLILVTVTISGISIRADAQDHGEDEGFKVLGTVIPTFEIPLNLDNTGDGEMEKGVFTGDFTGCKNRKDLLDYAVAKEDNNRTVMARFTSQGKCVPLAGRAYTPLRVGFGTSAVLLTIQGANVVMWVKSKALMESPPPGRPSHVDF